MYSTTTIQKYNGRLVGQNDEFFPANFNDRSMVMAHFEAHKGKGKYGERIVPKEVYESVEKFLHQMPFTMGDYERVYGWLYRGDVETVCGRRSVGDNYETDCTYYKEALQHFVREVFS